MAMSRLGFWMMPATFGLLMAAGIWFFVRAERARRVAAARLRVLDSPSDGLDLGSPLEGPSGGARARPDQGLPSRAGPPAKGLPQRMVASTRSESAKGGAGTAAACPAPPLAIAPFDAAKAKEHQQAWADYLGLPLETTNSIGMKFVLIPPGEFLMGSPPSEKYRGADELQHRVRITKAFHLGAYEVTQAQYQRVTGSNPSWFSPGGGGKNELADTADTSGFPVERVSWDDAVAFLQKLSASPEEKAAGHAYRLPTEAEWEYAARAGTTTAWSFGDRELVLSNFAWWLASSESKTHWVGSRRPNAFGLSDVHGNVWEWCADWYCADYYQQSPLADPTGPPDGQHRVLRGGSWGSDRAEYFRCAFRHHFPPRLRLAYRGFRVARTLTPGQ
jgi:formylglycine-generating enzyme required for sulfatase activity